MTLDDLDRYRPFWSSPVDGRLVPVDVAAEMTVAGCAVASVEGAVLAVERLTSRDFYDGRAWHAIDAAAQLSPDVVDDDDVWCAAARSGDWTLTCHGCVRRADAVADRTGLPLAWLTGVVSGRAVCVDRSGWHARRVRAAAMAREQIRAELARLEPLGVDIAALVSQPT